MKTPEQKIADLKNSLKIERGHVRDCCQTIARQALALQSIRDTAIAMDDAVRTYPTKRTVVCVEGPRRIKDAANRVLHPELFKATK